MAALGIWGPGEAVGWAGRGLSEAPGTLAVPEPHQMGPREWKEPLVNRRIPLVRFLALRQLGPLFPTPRHAATDCLPHATLPHLISFCPLPRAKVPRTPGRFPLLGTARHGSGLLSRAKAAGLEPTVCAACFAGVAAESHRDFVRDMF